MKKKELKKLKERLGRAILPPNKVHKDKKKFTRKVKHKQKYTPDGGNGYQIIPTLRGFLNSVFKFFNKINLKKGLKIFTS